MGLFMKKNLRMQQEMTDRGRLEIRVNARIQARPVSGARVTVSYTEIRRM